MNRFILIIAVSLCGCLPPGGTSPAPSPDIDFSRGTAIQKIFTEYRKGLKLLFEEVAVKIDEGQLDSETRVNQYIQDHSGELRQQTFMLLNEEASKIGGDKWTPEQAAYYWRKQGESL